MTMVVPGGTPTVIVISAPPLDLVPGFGAWAKTLPICSFTTCCKIWTWNPRLAKSVLAWASLKPTTCGTIFSPLEIDNETSVPALTAEPAAGSELITTPLSLSLSTSITGPSFKPLSLNIIIIISILYMKSRIKCYNILHNKLKIWHFYHK